MADPNAGSPPAASEPAPQRTALLPTNVIGWLAVALAVAGIASLVVVMVVADAANDPAAVNRGLMIGSIVLLVGATAVSVLCVTLWRQRSALNMLAVAACVTASALLLMLGLAGFFNGVL